MVNIQLSSWEIELAIQVQVTDGVDCFIFILMSLEKNFNLSPLPQL